jgi:RimJ/RimL family protein N-acetyltransferase
VTEAQLEVVLRDVEPADLPIFFEQERDVVACRMAAFTAEDPADRAAFDAHWNRILANPAVAKQTIVAGGRVAGYVASFEREGQPEVCYWLGREHWGRGVATRALAALLERVPVRPMYARAAKDNVASIRVLAKCGFVPFEEGHYFSHSRGAEVEELVLKREA